MSLFLYVLIIRNTAANRTHFLPIFKELKCSAHEMPNRTKGKFLKIRLHATRPVVPELVNTCLGELQAHPNKKGFQKIVSSELLEG